MNGFSSLAAASRYNVVLLLRDGFFRRWLYALAECILDKNYNRAH